jgi:hypothetical protein
VNRVEVDLVESLTHSMSPQNPKYDLAGKV